MRQKRDYYEVLGVGRDATEGEIKKAFRHLAKSHHPDRNPGDRIAEERFKEANEAYAVLSDPDKRAAYDRYGHAAFGVPNQHGQPTGPGFQDLSDMVEGVIDNLFGRKKKRQAGRDLRYTLEVSFEEAAFGGKKTIRFPTRKECTACEGTGAKGPSGQKPCQSCNGRGEVRFQQGFFTLSRTCSACQGAGKVVVDACSTCEGTGMVRIEREFDVTIPPATEDGNVRRVAKEGEPGRRGAAPGDLHVVIRVAPHPILKRQGHDVVAEVPITFTQAALGANIEVPTLDGKVKMRIPEGTQSHRVFRLKGKGMPRGEGVSIRGDQHVKVVVETPSQLTPRQRELLEELAHEGGETVGQPQKKKFLDKVRDLFDV